MLTQGSYIVADFGKTNSKLTLWSKDGECLAKEVRANDVTPAEPYVPLDVVGISEWLTVTLSKFAEEPVEAIIPVAHGAAVAGIKPSTLQGRGLGEGVSAAVGVPLSPALSPEGERETLAFLPMDYEWDLPEIALAKYRSQRDSFGVTGSPAFPMGLNVGAQLYLLETQGKLEGATLLPYAQYWAWFLSGVTVSEVTSLGCHSDLWSPAAGDFSPMARRRGWAGQFAPLAKAGDVIGTLRPELVRRTSLSPEVKIHTGLHDSNAALVAARGFPEIADNEATVLSTGTWFVMMRSAQGKGDLTALPEARDCLINVDVHGNPLPSARFMGGREAELLGGLADGLEGLEDVVAAGTLILPSQVQGSGPFPNATPGVLNGASSPAAAALYLALMTETSLSLIGTKEGLLIEGRFAENQLFTRALATLRPDLTILTASAEADVSFGALRMIDPTLKPAGALNRVMPLDVDLKAYQAEWKSRIGEGL